MEWKNRIVGHGVKRASEFTAHPENWRLHHDFQRKVVAGSLDEIGWFDEVIVNVQTGHVIDGHERIALALAKDDAEVPFQLVDLSPEEEKLALLLKDSSSALAGVNQANLTALMGAVAPEDERLQAMLNALGKKEFREALAAAGELMAPTVAEEAPEDQGAQIDRAGELQEKWQVQAGDVWMIGKHRLMCGDSTNAADVARLMGGERADGVITDPPYNVGIDYGFQTDDKRDEGDYIEWSRRWLSQCPPKRVISVGIRNLLLWDDIAGQPQWIIAWIKMNGQSQTGFQGTNKWDAILTYNVPIDHQIDIIELNNDYSQNIVSSGLHVVPKPVELWTILLNRFSSGREIIFDPFGGSGTTMAACEQLGRQCRMMEIEPKYCAVILERMSGMGLEPHPLTPSPSHGEGGITPPPDPLPVNGEGE